MTQYETLFYSLLMYLSFGMFCVLSKCSVFAQEPFWRFKLHYPRKFALLHVCRAFLRRFADRRTVIEVNVRRGAVSAKEKHFGAGAAFTDRIMWKSWSHDVIWIWTCKLESKSCQLQRWAHSDFILVAHFYPSEGLNSCSSRVLADFVDG